ncbi:hypothetical protein CBR_g10785 [Chara braunii]|uniref:Uncharacterized protein n=1 Tax=Chara braunii TaxID=69332 RepID=A0A388KP66_CHABU|nr:hypothetical protein CBR_g10785 [Chara braunii]|eukprot:GBG71846.1 hypothetical protein CBR_g10785 [Chara braunii]
MQSVREPRLHLRESVVVRRKGARKCSGRGKWGEGRKATDAVEYLSEKSELPRSSSEQVGMAAVPGIGKRGRSAQQLVEGLTAPVRETGPGGSCHPPSRRVAMLICASALFLLAALLTWRCAEAAPTPLPPPSLTARKGGRGGTNGLRQNPRSNEGSWPDSRLLTRGMTDNSPKIMSSSERSGEDDRHEGNQLPSSWSLPKSSSSRTSTFFSLWFTASRSAVDLSGNPSAAELKTSDREASKGTAAGAGHSFLNGQRVFREREFNFFRRRGGGVSLTDGMQDNKAAEYGVHGVGLERTRVLEHEEERGGPGTSSLPSAGTHGRSASGWLVRVLSPHGGVGKAVDISQRKTRKILCPNQQEEEEEEEEEQKLQPKLIELQLLSNLVDELGWGSNTASSSNRVVHHVVGTATFRVRKVKRTLRLPGIGWSVLQRLLGGESSPAKRRQLLQLSDQGSGRSELGQDVDHNADRQRSLRQSDPEGDTQQFHTSPDDWGAQSQEDEFAKHESNGKITAPDAVWLVEGGAGGGGGELRKGEGLVDVVRAGFGGTGI